MQAQWGCLILLELGQNPWEELGQNAHSQSEHVQHAVGLIFWESSPAQEPASELLHQQTCSSWGKVAGLLSSFDPQQLQGGKIEENALYWILPAQW